MSELYHKCEKCDGRRYLWPSPDDIGDMMKMSACKACGGAGFVPANDTLLWTIDGKNITDSDPVGWKIIATGDDGSVLCESPEGHRRRYLFCGMFLSRLDSEVIKQLLGTYTKSQHPFTLGQFMSCQHPSWRDLKSCRERDECLAKFQRLGIVET
jgi:hypothetical protein